MNRHSLYLRITLFCLTLSLAILGCRKDKFDIEGKFNDAAANPGKWTFVKNGSMLCRDGSSTGLIVRLNPNSDKVLVYLMGGGACFNQITCDENPSKFDSEDAAGFRDGPGNSGIFNTSNPDNPFADWNHVIVPYCTGDLHSGLESSQDVTNGPSDQFMFGYNNLSLAAFDIESHFHADNVSELFVAGSSAGGYGVLLGMHHFSLYFPDTIISGVNDGGALILKENVVPQCLQDIFESEMALKLPDGSDDQITGFWGTGIKGMYEFSANHNPDINMGLLTHTEDAVIRYFMGFGENNCAQNEAVVPAADFSNGLVHLRDSVFPYLGNWATYYAPGEGHTFLMSDAGLSTVVNGVPLTDWLNDLRAGNAGDVSE